MEITKYLIIRKLNKPDILLCLLFSNLKSIELVSLFFKRFKLK